VRARAFGLVACAVLAAAGCSDEGALGPAGAAPSQNELVCDLDSNFLADGGVGRDGIPALTDPTFLPAEPMVDQIAYFKPEDRVIAYWSGGEWLVIPHNIMWRHEIVNLPEAVITYCPLTGSALAFSRGGSSGGAEFGVSGLLYNANLVLYDRTQPEESLWPQMLGEARCGPRSGQALTRVPVFEMTWQGWVELHPDSKVLALTPGMFDPALYFFNPYGLDYEDPDNADYLGMPMTVRDDRRPPKERVLGIPGGERGGLAFPFLAMAEAGDLAVFDFVYEGEPAVVLWDAARQSAMAFRSTVQGSPTTFQVSERGFVDDATGSVWAVDGTAIGGALAGSSVDLRPVTDAYVAFWGAWAAFHPQTELALGG
jgi:hypothetical protein